MVLRDYFRTLKKFTKLCKKKNETVFVFFGISYALQRLNRRIGGKIVNMVRGIFWMSKFTNQNFYNCILRQEQHSTTISTFTGDFSQLNVL